MSVFRHAQRLLLAAGIGLAAPAAAKAQPIQIIPPDEIIEIPAPTSILNQTACAYNQLNDLVRLRSVMVFAVPTNINGTPYKADDVLILNHPLIIGGGVK